MRFSQKLDNFVTAKGEGPNHCKIDTVAYNYNEHYTLSIIH